MSDVQNEDKKFGKENKPDHDQYINKLYHEINESPLNWNKIDKRVVS